jgi:hypothetical protein
MSIQLTDEEVKNFRYHFSPDLDGYKHEYLMSSLENLLNLLSPEQIKQLAESKDMYCGQWIKFDKDNVNSWPEDETKVLALCPWGDVEMFNYGEDDGIPEFSNFDYDLDDVTHYTPLPTFKEK